MPCSRDWLTQFKLVRDHDSAYACDDGQVRGTGGWQVCGTGGGTGDWQVCGSGVGLGAGKFVGVGVGVGLAIKQVCGGWGLAIYQSMHMKLTLAIRTLARFISSQMRNFTSTLLHAHSIPGYEMAHSYYVIDSRAQSLQDASGEDFGTFTHPVTGLAYRTCVSRETRSLQLYFDEGSGQWRPLPIAWVCMYCCLPECMCLCGAVCLAFVAYTDPVRVHSVALI